VNLAALRDDPPKWTLYDDADDSVTFRIAER
jgi:hypothetical protein